MTVSWPPREPVRFGVLCAWLAVLALAGGASRADEPQQMWVRLAAIIVILGHLCWPRSDRLRRQRVPLLFAATCGGLVLLQLVPLPFAMWRTLPGHGFYADLAGQLGIAPAFRPWSMTPDLTVNALLALLPAVATLIAVSSMARPDRPLLIAPLLTLAVAGAVLGLDQIAGGINSPLRFYRITNADAAVGFFANRNHHALMAAIGITLLGPVHAALAKRKALRIAAPAFVIAVGTLLGLSILAAGSRAGLIVAVLGAIGTFVWSRAEARPAPRRRSSARMREERAGRLILAAVMLILPLGLLTFAITGSRAPAWQRMMQTHATEESRYVWLPTLTRTAEAFLPIGSGFGSFDPVYRRFEDPALLGPHYANEAHNDLLQLTIEGGLPALSLLGLFLAWWLRRGFALVWRDRRDGGDARDAGRLGVLQTMLILGFSLVDYPLRTPLLASVFIIACTTMLRPPPSIAPGQEDEYEPRSSKVARRSTPRPQEEPMVHS